MCLSNTTLLFFGLAAGLIGSFLITSETHRSWTRARRSRAKLLPYSFAAGVAEYNASLNATSRGSPPIITPIRFVTYA